MSVPGITHGKGYILKGEGRANTVGLPVVRWLELLVKFDGSGGKAFEWDSSTHGIS